MTKDREGGTVTILDNLIGYKKRTVIRHSLIRRLRVIGCKSDLLYLFCSVDFVLTNLSLDP